MAELDPTRMSIDEQVAFLLDGTYFADEAGGAGELRGQMGAELKAKLELSAKLRAKGDPDWRLRVYIGADPTRESLHIGHMIPVVRMRRFQQLGHQAIFLIGDYTAMIGDPSGASAEREPLTHERVLELSRFYTGQAARLLHADARDVEHPGGTVHEPGVEVRYNGEWLAGLGFAQLAEIAGQFSLNRVIAREDFRKRMEAGGSVSMHETFYALMQGYDAFALNCDVQVGGYDQHLNLLAGRELQRYFEKKFKGADHPLYAAQPQTGRRVKGPHAMVTCPLLMGTDGRKMSKSWGNTIDVLDTPADMFGKVMRISDEMIGHYIDIAVDAPAAEKDQWKQRAAGEPMEAKKWIAHSVTALYNGTEAADQAAEHFKRTVQEKTVDLGEVPEVRVPDAWRAEHLGLVAQASVPVASHERPSSTFPATVDDFRTYSRNLPHWRLSGSVYFVTWRLDRSHGELPASAREIVADALRHFDGQRYYLVGFVVMDDHVHVLVKPIEGTELSSLTHSWKSYSANRIQREIGWMGAIWQGESWDRIVRNEDELFEKAQYLLHNPAKRWPGIVDYRWTYLNLDAANEFATGTEACATIHAVTASQIQTERQPRLVDLLLELDLVPSKSEARRLIEQGGVKLDGAAVCDQFAPYIHLAPTLLQIGKRKVVRLI